MSNHGNRAQAAKVNKRGEPTNAAARTVEQNAADTALARMADQRLRAAQPYLAVAHAEEAKVPAARAAFYRTQSAWTTAETRAQQAREHYQQVRSGLEARLTRQYGPMPTKLFGLTPEQMATARAHNTATEQDAPFQHALRALDEAQQQAQALKHIYDAAYDQYHAQSRAAMVARFAAETRVAGAQRLTDPAAHAYDHITPRALAELAHSRTTLDVVGWLERNLPGITVKLHGATVQAAREAATELATLARQYPYAAARLDHLIYLSDRNAAAEVAAHGLADERSVTSRGMELAEIGGQAGKRIAGQRDRYGVVLSNVVLNDLHPDMQTYWERDAQVGWSARRAGVSPAAYVMRHEFGHLIEYTMKSRAADANRAEPTYLGAKTAVTHLASLADQTPARVISQYATKSDAERFAEAFAGAQYGTPALQQALRADPYTQAVLAAAEAYG
jgi:hypothetical protein